jgi:phage shock protein PspC (stress-responsive transcriptional regulator)
MSLLHETRYFFEKRGFEVCSRLAERLGMKAKNVRIFFIYLSFFSLGGGFALYLVLAFWLKMKDFLFSKRSSVFDL